jgi:hypothetical protein
MNTYTSTRNLIWENDRQIRRVFGWEDLLNEWNQSLNPSVYITTVIENLKANSDPSKLRDFPLSHFLTFLNEEEPGMKWLIYEIVAQRWMYGYINLDYLRELVDEVDVDTGFPAFVGSPLNTKTVRQFLEENLSTEELSHVAMMPGLIPIHTYSYTQTLGRPLSNTPIKPPPLAFQLRFLQSGKGEVADQGHDTVVNIFKAGNDTYKMSFLDKEVNQKNVTQKMSRQDVLRYLSVYLRSLAMDDDPICSVQIVPPNAPSTLYSIKTIDRSYVRDLIYDSLEITMDNWPERV